MQVILNCTSKAVSRRVRSQKYYWVLFVGFITNVHAMYKYYVFVRPEVLNNSKFKIQNPKLNCRDSIMAAINAEGIPCFSGSCSEIYREKAFADADIVPAERLPVAKELGETSLMFLVHPTLCEDDMQDTVRAVEKVMAKAV